MSVVVTKDYKLKVRNLHASHTLGWSYCGALNANLEIHCFYLFRYDRRIVYEPGIYSSNRVVSTNRLVTNSRSRDIQARESFLRQPAKWDAALLSSALWQRRLELSTAFIPLRCPPWPREMLSPAGVWHYVRQGASGTKCCVSIA